jgi:hypothetical protein
MVLCKDNKLAGGKGMEITQEVRKLQPEERLAIQLAVVREMKYKPDKKYHIRKIKKYLRIKGLTLDLKKMLLYKLWVLKNHPVLVDIRWYYEKAPE